MKGAELPQGVDGITYALPKVTPAVFNGDVRNLPQVPVKPQAEFELKEPESTKTAPAASPSPGVPKNIPLAPMPGAIQNFAGLSKNDTCDGGPCGSGWPPDTNGDVGPNHYIQSVNSSFAIYNKTGTLLASFTENSLWSGSGSNPCNGNSQGDPVVLYDSMADRWILTNFAFPTSGGNPVSPFYQCIAVSKTGDPVTGGWYLYPIRTDTGATGQPPVNTLNDYPKFGIWTDCLYYSANGFLFPHGAYNGGEFGSFSKADMYSGAALTGSLGFTVSSNDLFTMLPSNLSAPADGLPPPGRRNIFVQESLTAFNFRVRTFTPGPNCGAGGTLSGATIVSQANYTVPGANIVPQPLDSGSLFNLDSLGDRMMQKAQYRNVGGAESVWVTHTFRSSASGPTGSQWAQINVTGGIIAPAPAQEQLYNPADGIYRWMSSIAADRNGNVALGYSTSNGTVPNFPSIAYSGRLAGDPVNTLPQTETQLVAGSGSQLNFCGGAPCHRWGDYSSMSIDPSDSCTFWFTSQYYVDQAGGNSGNWNTRIGSFSFTQPGDCTPMASTPVVPAAPTNLTFTSVGPVSMTLNWTDNATNEDRYLIYQSLDNVNFTFAAQAAADATSQSISGLNQNTTYFFKVYAHINGALSTALSGSQATTAPGVVNSVLTGLWSDPATWGGSVPTSNDDVTITNGTTVTIDSSNALNVTVQNGGVLQFEATTARTLTVGQSVTIDAGGTFRSNPSGTQTGHVLSVGRNLTNNGTLDFSTNGNTAGAGITFTGAANNTFGGTGATTNIRTLTISKGAFSNILELNPSAFTVQGTTVDGTPMAFLTLTSGTLKVSGSFALTGRLFTTAAYTIGANAGLWLNNPNFAVAGQNGSPNTNGLLRISQGTLNIGTSTGNSMGFGLSSTITVEGGAVNATGRFGVSGQGNHINYTQTGGTITVCTIGTNSTTLACFDLGTALLSNIAISGGTIINQVASTAASGPRDYRNQAGAGITTVTGGTLQLGNASSGAAQAFTIVGVIPNLVITNTSANHTATLNTTLLNYNNISLNITVNTGNTVNFSNTVFLFGGTTLTNNGTITHNGASSRFFWFATSLAQTYTGSGTVTAPMTSLEVQDGLGLTINPASPNIVASRVILFSGGVTNANKITLGNGGTTTGVVQIGNTTTPTAAGIFDVPMTFNLGTGGEIVSYLRTTTSRTTGGEINPARTLTSMTYDDNDVAHTLTIAGGNLTLSSTGAALTMTNGRIITGANILALSSGTATVTRTNGYVDGNFRKTYSSAGATKTFEVGTANGYSPVTVNITAATVPVDFTVKAVQGPQPNILSPTHALQRYWTLTATGVTANLTFNYLDPTDIPVTANESGFVILKYDGGFSMPGGSVNTAANTATINGVTSFSDWTLGEPGAPTDVAVNWFTADAYTAAPESPNGGALLRWQTGYEVANLGFNIYRDEAGKRVRVTPGMVAGSAFFVGARTVLGAGRSYVWRDTQGVSNDAEYWLESVDINGVSTWYGPVRASSDSKKSTGSLETNSKLIRDLGQDLGGPEATNPVETKPRRARTGPEQLEVQAVAAGQPAVKIAVRREGWYRIPQSELAAAGLDPRVDPMMLQLRVDGQEQPMNVLTDNDGRISAVEFYGIGADSPYTNLRTYWLSAGDKPGKRIEQVHSAGSAAAGGSFAYSVERRDRTVYFAALRNGERENFFGAVIARDPVDQSLTVQRLDAGAATLEVVLQGVTTAGHSVNVELNGANVGAVAFIGQAAGIGRFNLPPALLKEGQNVVRLTSLGGQGDVSLVDYIGLTYQHRYTADNDVLRFTAAGKQQVTIDGFSSSAIRVLDVTNSNSVQELIGVVQPQKSGYAVGLDLRGSGQRTLLAIAGDLARPVGITANIPSAWRQPANGADLIVLTRSDFFGALEPLRSLRQKQGYSVALVDIEDVYDEFSYGQKTPQAVKDFFAYAARAWKKAPRFALLAADASLDPKNYLGFGDSDFVPTRLVDTQLMETASDDWFVDFNADGLPDLAIGRLPVRSATEALTLATKIASYDGRPSTETLVLVSDHNDTYDFETASSLLRGLVPANIRIETVDRSRMDDSTAKATLIDAINRGPIIVNYVGHGSVDQWRGNILTSGDAAGLTNTGDLSLFVMMTCLNGYFHDAALESLGESLLKAGHGGAVAVWGSSGMTTPEFQSILNEQAYRMIFGGTPMTLGEATARAKAAVANSDVRRTWILLGDPTTRLAR